MEALLENRSGQRSACVQRWVTWLIAAALAVALPLMIPFDAAAANSNSSSHPSVDTGPSFELSAGLSYNKTTYGVDSYSWSRRIGASFAYYLTERSSIELAYQDAFLRNNIAGIEDTSFHDKIYSVDWTQHLTGKDWPVQPYIKLGVGELNRTASGSYAAGGAPPEEYDTLTTILGAGIKIYLSRSFALRAEATTYLTDLQLGSWQDNDCATAGISIFF